MSYPFLSGETVFPVPYSSISIYPPVSPFIPGTISMDESSTSTQILSQTQSLNVSNMQPVFPSNTTNVQCNPIFTFQNFSSTILSTTAESLQSTSSAQSTVPLIQRSAAVQSTTPLVSTQSNHICKQCNKQFASASSLSNHAKTHQPESERKYICNVCETSFSLSSYLSVHMRRHTGERPFACDYCDRSFSQKSGLNTHTRRQHPLIKTTNQSIDLTTNHQVGENGAIDINIDFLLDNMDTVAQVDDSNTVTPIDNSDTVTLVDDDMNTMAPVNEVNDEQRRPHKCIVCEKRFTSKAYLGTHLKTHLQERQHQCQHCGARFTQKSSLNTHCRLRHSDLGEHESKPYECIVCNKSFALKFYLTVHARTHTGEKPFTCVVCSKSYSQRSALNVHRKRSNHI